MADSRRIKYTLMLAIVAGSCLALLASTQTWFSLLLNPAANHTGSVTIQGSAAAPALTALSLAGLALAGALAIAGPIVRLVMSALGILLGICVLISTFIAVGGPVRAAASAVTTATGVSGDASVARLVKSVDTEIWPWVAVAGGVVLVVASVAVIATSRRWPGTSRRFDRVRFDDVSEAAGTDRPLTAATSREKTQADAEQLNARDIAIDTWDELSRGEDPTR